MDEIVIVVLEILKYTVPSGVVFITAYFMLRQFLDDKRTVEMIKAKAEARSNVLPTRLQAYERLILFLERIEPSGLILRVFRPAMTAKVLHRELVKTVREEYEHNMVQQLYISDDCWQQVGSSKDAVIQLINLANEKVTDSASGSEFSNILFEIVGKAGVSPTESGIVALKTEARQLL